MIKHYFQLVRFPGIFTTFTNILVGYFFVNSTNIEWLSLAPLLCISGFLFLAGMSLNDYFDYKIDKLDRPTRPLPSDKIKRKNALLLGIAFLIIANLFSAYSGVQTLTISLIMTFLIIIYDTKTKSIPLLGIVNLSSIRFLNIILGTTILSLSYEVISVAIPIAVFVGGISVLAKNEIGNNSRKAEITNILCILFTIFYVIVLTYKDGFEHFVLLGLFGVFTLLPNYIFSSRKNLNIQKRVTYQLYAIIILDSSLIMAFSEMLFAILALSFLLPAYVIGKKLYVT